MDLNSEFDLDLFHDNNIYLIVVEWKLISYRRW